MANGLRVALKVDIRDFLEGLARLDDVVSEEEMVAAVQSGANLFKNAWKRRAPYRTGNYRRSIADEVVEQSRQRVIIKIGTSIIDPPYPIHLEFGTRHMAAQPSARPAWDETKAKMEPEMRASLKALIARAGRR